MNKRQKKKYNKRLEYSIAWGAEKAISYRSLKELERGYWEWTVWNKKWCKVNPEINNRPYGWLPFE